METPLDSCNFLRKMHQSLAWLSQQVEEDDQFPIGICLNAGVVIFNGFQTKAANASLSMHKNIRNGGPLCYDQPVYSNDWFFNWLFHLTAHNCQMRLDDCFSTFVPLFLFRCFGHARCLNTMGRPLPSENPHLFDTKWKFNEILMNDDVNKLRCFCDYVCSRY